MLTVHSVQKCIMLAIYIQQSVIMKMRTMWIWL